VQPPNGERTMREEEKATKETNIDERRREE
jgi:hypothetical protein